MTTAHTPEAPWPSENNPQPCQTLSEALATATLAGLTHEAREALTEARNLLEDRLAAIASGEFSISSWTDEDGDVLALRIEPRSLLNVPPADTFRKLEDHANKPWSDDDARENATE